MVEEVLTVPAVGADRPAAWRSGVGGPGGTAPGSVTSRASGRDRSRAVPGAGENLAARRPKELMRTSPEFAPIGEQEVVPAVRVLMTGLIRTLIPDTGWSYGTAPASSARVTVCSLTCSFRVAPDIWAAQWSM